MIRFSDSPGPNFAALDLEDAAPRHNILGPLLDSGVTGDVFGWGTGKVIKLFHKTWSDQRVESELNRWMIINEKGLAVPRCFGRVDLDGRIGIVFDLVDGAHLSHVLARNLLRWPSLVREFALTQRRIHTVIENRLPSVATGVRRSIDLAPQVTAAQKNGLQKLVDLLPVGDRLCHFDYHGHNVLVTKGGGLVVIDWATAHSGNPLADVARTCVVLALHGVPKPPVAQYVAGLGSKLFAAAYLRHYFQGRPTAEREELKRWLPVIAAAKMREAAHYQTPILIEIIERGLFEAKH